MGYGPAATESNEKYYTKMVPIEDKRGFSNKHTVNI